MDTIYALVVILTGTLVPGDEADENVLSGEVQNKTTVYFKTLEACELAYAQALASKEEMVIPNMNVTVEVKPCEGIQVVE